MAGPESGEQMTTQIRPLAVLSATHQEVRQRSDSLPFTHSAPQAILVQSSATAVDFVSRMDFKTRQKGSKKELARARKCYTMTNLIQKSRIFNEWLKETNGANSKNVHADK